MIICVKLMLFCIENVKTFVVKTQLNHNQVEVGLTTLWDCNPPPTHPVKLCVVVVQLSSNQQHNTDKS